MEIGETMKAVTHLIAPTALAFLASSGDMLASSSHSRTSVSRTPDPAGIPPAKLKTGENSCSLCDK